MYKFLLLVPLGFALSLTFPPARADLPSLTIDPPANTGASEADQGRALEAEVGGLDSWRKSRLFSFNLGAVDYRLARDGIKASFPIGRSAMTTLLGYGGEHRLQVDWRSYGGSVKLAVTTDEHSSGYRLEYVRRF